MWESHTSPHKQATLRQQWDVLQFSSILTLSTRRRHQIPQGKGSVLRNCPHPTSDASYHLPFWPTGYRLKVPTVSSSVSINLLERLTKVRETFHLLDSGTGRWKRSTEKGMEKGLGGSSSPLVQNLPKFTDPVAGGAGGGPTSWDFTEASSRRHD